MAIHYPIANLNETINLSVVTSINTLHLATADATHSQKPPRLMICPPINATDQGFLKQKSRGNHHAIGFYFVKSEQC
jgi:hypothetical protein